MVSPFYPGQTCLQSLCNHLLHSHWLVPIQVVVKSNGVVISARNLCFKNIYDIIDSLDILLEYFLISFVLTQCYSVLIHFIQLILSFLSPRVQFFQVSFLIFRPHFQLVDLV